MPQVFFKKAYQEAIRAGRKSTTIRRWNKPMIRAGQRAFSPGLGWLAIESVEAIELDALDEADANSDGFQTVMQMRQQLRSLYPNHVDDGKRWFRVRFRLHVRARSEQNTATEDTEGTENTEEKPSED